ncbi:molybdate ABC transporter substrate-binding protein [Caballeronia sordidicola]|uniref:Molybdate ABC transporter substrate-binding protein n=1 Tax=Caballeronia sordidicola TaxID=196367 RepID=A0A158GDV3_CABSO|nr:substrate-binding domain-containing protein [Caballeronia sordidicola]SAL30216.1 molybdate ABC transporter substrate-binding protein [Caballeronia sordidicola]
MTKTLHVISSMATRHVLNELAELFQRQHSCRLDIESVGGVVAAQRVQAGDAFDVAVLAADAIEALAQAGKVRAATCLDVACAEVAVAVRRGAPRPDIGSEAALKHAVEAASSIGYSTGPSGTHLQSLFERWGMAEAIAGRTILAPPGTPVGALVAEGRAELGFQQLSEMIHLQGIEVLGPLPPGVHIVTVFSAALTAGAVDTQLSKMWLAFLVSPEADEVKRRNGMTPAQ